MTPRLQPPQSLITLPVLVLVVGLAACGQKDGTTPPSDGEAVTNPTVATAPAPVPAPMATQAAIAVNAGPDGTQVSLMKARVTGNILTVELSVRPPTDKYTSVLIDLEDVSVIDDTTSQRYGVLRDATNQWMASPLGLGKEGVTVSLSNNQPGVAWFKFPAPPATSPTVSINIPGVGPFDGVTVQR